MQENKDIGKEKPKKILSFFEKVLTYKYAETDHTETLHFFYIQRTIMLSFAVFLIMLGSPLYIFLGSGLPIILINLAIAIPLYFLLPKIALKIIRKHLYEK